MLIRFLVPKLLYWCFGYVHFLVIAFEIINIFEGKIRPSQLESRNSGVCDMLLTAFEYLLEKRFHIFWCPYLRIYLCFNICLMAFWELHVHEKSQYDTQYTKMEKSKNKIVGEIPPRRALPSSPWGRRKVQKKLSPKFW